MDLIFKTSITLFVVGLLTFVFWLCLSVFFDINHNKYMKVAAIGGGFLSISGLTLFVLNILIDIWGL